MAIDHIEFLESAKSLPEQGEINWRNTISRAYYAAFHACNSFYRTSFSEEGGLHAKLIRTMQKSPHSQDREIGLMLFILKGQRVKADYDLNLDLKNSDRETSILQAEQIMSKIDAMTTVSSVTKNQN